MALPRQKRFSVFNKIHLVNHMHDILDYSCKRLVFKYSYRCKGPKNAFGFTLSNLIISLMISQKLHTKVAQMS